MTHTDCRSAWKIVNIVILAASILLPSVSAMADGSVRIFITPQEITPWPFIQEKYTLGCMHRNIAGFDRYFVFLSDTMDTYALNGAARGIGINLFGWKDAKVLQKHNTVPADTHQVIDLGLKLCTEQ